VTLGPRNLVGQMALLIAVALFVAQAINFALLLRERRQFALQQVTTQAATRIADALERVAQGRRPGDDRGRLRLVARNPIVPDARPNPAIAAGVRAALAESGIAVGRITAGLTDIRPDSPLLRRVPEWRARYLRENGAELVIAVERPGLGWLVQRGPWVQRDAWLVWRLGFQTLVLFGVVLIPVLWATRRIARPLRDLTHAAERFRPGSTPVPVPESGPRDVVALIAAFNALATRIGTMLDEKDHMLGAIGHDLRTPLAALRVRIESVEDDTDRARMADTVDEMNRTLDDILSLARLGRPSEAATEVDVAALVDAVVEDFRDLGAPVTFEDGKRLPLRLRPGLMRRAVRNLIENAVKYGRVAHVSVVASPRDVSIIVADDGPGIPEDRLAEVFDAFTRLETSRNRETGGIGLGLALARAIVREGGGDIVLANRPEGGLTATITLPR
jgi:signal transduction histidine kinase